jgi:mRNA interferase HicA
MKQRDLVKKLLKNGWRFERHGSEHDMYEKNGELESVPRHRDVNEKLARAIISRRGLK